MNIIPIETGPKLTPSKRAKRFYERWITASQATDVALHAAGLLQNPYLSPGAAQLTGVHALRCREQGAALEFWGYFEHRIHQFEHTIRTVLASDALTADERREMLSGVYGKALAKRHTAALLSERESQLVEHYRAMDAAGRQMLQSLCARLATSSEIGR